MIPVHHLIRLVTSRLSTTLNIKPILYSTSQTNRPAPPRLHGYIHVYQDQPVVAVVNLACGDNCDRRREEKRPITTVDMVKKRGCLRLA